MSEIQRWEVGFSQMNEHDQGEFVTWNDHVAALKAARSPEPKFKVGDVVTLSGSGCNPVTISKVNFSDNCYRYFIGKGWWVGESEIVLYVPPTPAELIPTLKEHEWVRFRVSTSGRLFTSTTYFDGDGSLCADDYQLRGSHAKSTAYNVNIESIERCDPPEVK
jgi:hypothetical protein